MHEIDLKMKKKKMKNYQRMIEGEDHVMCDIL